ncbi:MAG TPA: Rieske 2Fe-2S domain-containing protein [Actinomycetota bacterium]|jgi:3-phenylpropionate/trans-cinnamate dioxygenase ferredoxin subunit|nr:Rieske 2Fe-2S domain-containing protein [Actinomycetota bacterium]
MEHLAGSAEALRREGCRVIEAEGRRVAVLSVGERFFALRDRCPHKGASLCEGTVGGTFLPSAPQEYLYGMDNSVIRCPWHGWEFDLETGRSLMEPDDVGVQVYPVSVDGDTVIVHT